MSNLIGVTVPPPRDYKRLLLMFDGMLWTPCRPLPKVGPFDGPNGPQYAVDLPGLSQQFADELSYLFSEGLLAYEDEMKMSAPVEGRPDVVLGEFVFAYDPHVGTKAETWVVNGACRGVVDQLRAGGVNAVPIQYTDWAGGLDNEVTSVEVAEIVINSLPVPDDGHSVEDIVAFRNEMKSRGLMSGLRVWIEDVGAGRSTLNHASQKLEHLIGEYERAMARERMNQSTSRVETLVVTTAEVAEALVKFQWSKIAAKLFEVRRRRVELLKAESTAPGKEVAYVVKAREHFGQVEGGGR